MSKHPLTAHALAAVGSLAITLGETAWIEIPAIVVLIVAGGLAVRRDLFTNAS